MENQVLLDYERILEAQLGSIASYHLLSSKEASKVIRDLSKRIDALSVQLRKELIESDKLLTKHD